MSRNVSAMLVCALWPASGGSLLRVLRTSKDGHHISPRGLVCALCWPPMCTPWHLQAGSLVCNTSPASASLTGSCCWCAVLCCAAWPLLCACPSFIKEHYQGPDKSRIWLFGLSRGAYTVRAVAGMINNCGIIKRTWPEPGATGACAHSRARHARMDETL